MSETEIRADERRKTLDQAIRVIQNARTIGGDYVQIDAIDVLRHLRDRPESTQ